MKVSKLVRWLSDLINLSRRLAIWRLGRMKLNSSQQNSIICILSVLKSFIINRFATKLREFSWDLFRFNISKPYHRIGIHLYFTECSTTSSEVQLLLSVDINLNAKNYPMCWQLKLQSIDFKRIFLSRRNINEQIHETICGCHATKIVTKKSQL